MSIVTTSGSTPSQRPDVRGPLWCAVGSLVLMWSLFYDGSGPELRWVEFVWIGFLAFPYLLIVFFLTAGWVYVALIVALPVSVIMFLLLLLTLAMGLGQGGQIKASNALWFLSQITFVSVQVLLFLTALVAVSKIPKAARHPPAWVIVVLTLVSLYGLQSLIGWIIGLALAN